MLNKKAQIMSSLMVLITAFMCLTAIGVYSIQIKNLQTSIISPAVIQEREDISTLLEIQEREMLINSIGNLTWDDKDFKKNVSENFFRYLEKRPKIISILIEDLYDLDNPKNPTEEETVEKKINYIKHNIYNLEYNGKEMILERRSTKEHSLIAQNPKKISFGMNLILPFESKIIIKEADVKFLQENKQNP